MLFDICCCLIFILISSSLTELARVHDYKYVYVYVRLGVGYGRANKKYECEGKIDNCFWMLTILSTEDQS